MVDIRVTLVDGKAHSVDSSDAAFQVAGALALREAAEQRPDLLLEPVDEVGRSRVPDEYVGAVMSDLSGRRGRVHRHRVDRRRSGTVVSAEVPEIELLRYAIELRSITAGTGPFTPALPAARARCPGTWRARRSRPPSQD